ncbi:DUF7344 domain-containing protein [Haloprofundus halobius]|uniref:DUF7344 domain-containing protein n=1 Tax=Haloprofundus halobius TaxID=2876194 RepID=UPI001CCF1FBE|nr:hypothetical protein [Haloprofundus halobius]
MTSSSETAASDITLSVPAGQPPEQLFRTLANRRRRAILKLLLDRPTPLAETRLCRLLVAHGRDSSPSEVSDARLRSMRLSVHHTHLPALQAAKLVEWERSVGRVDTAAHPVYDDPAFRWLVGDETPFDPTEIDANLALLASPHRRLLVEILCERERSTVDELVDALAAEEMSEPSDDVASRVAVGLRHAHLPRLVDTGVVERDDGVVVYLGNRFLDAWTCHASE